MRVAGRSVPRDEQLYMSFRSEESQLPIQACRVSPGLERFSHGLLRCACLRRLPSTRSKIAIALSSRFSVGLNKPRCLQPKLQANAHLTTVNARATRPARATSHALSTTLSPTHTQHLLHRPHQSRDVPTLTQQQLQLHRPQQIQQLALWDMALSPPVQRLLRLPNVPWASRRLTDQG